MASDVPSFGVLEDVVRVVIAQALDVEPEAFDVRVEPDPVASRQALGVHGTPGGSTGASERSWVDRPLPSSTFLIGPMYACGGDRRPDVSTPKPS